MNTCAILLVYLIPSPYTYAFTYRWFVWRSLCLHYLTPIPTFITALPLALTLAQVVCVAVTVRIRIPLSILTLITTLTLALTQVVRVAVTVPQLEEMATAVREAWSSARVQ